PWWSVWGGKLLAAIVLTLAAGAIVLVPSALTGDWSLPPAGWWGLLGIPGLLAVIGGVHAVAVGYRSRSGWFAADLALATLLGWSGGPAPAGPWIVVRGRRRWPRPQSMLPTLLVDPGTGRFVRVSWSIDGSAFSADGARAAWIQRQWDPDPRLFVADLRAASV